MSDEKHSAGENRDILRQFVVGVAGALLYSVMWFVGPRPHPRSVLAPGPGNAPGIVAWLFSLFNLMENYYVQLGILIIFVGLALFRWKDRRAWIYAFLSGWGLAGLTLALRW